nr:MAG TPA: homing endonuclease [Caudoviricetes sp.]
MKLLEKLPEDALQVKGALNWVDKNGNLYGIETRVLPLKNGRKVKHKNYGKYFKYSTFTNNQNGYVYGNIKYIKDKKNNIFETKQRRLHIVIAETFLENPNNYPVVGHRNNIKSDNRVDNLYWTTYKENTQKAVDDGLLVNKKGYEDSQSKPVIMFDTYTNKEIGRYGSMKEAERETGIKLNTISRQAKYKKPVRKPYYFRFQDDNSTEPPTIVIQYDMYTHNEIARFINTGEAEKKTGISQKVISDQCRNNKVPQWTKSKTYFLYKKANQ